MLEEQHPNNPAIIPIITRNYKRNRPNPVSKSSLNSATNGHFCLCFIFRPCEWTHHLRTEIHTNNIWSKLQTTILSSDAEIKKNALGALCNCIHKRWKLKVNISTVYSIVTNTGENFICITAIHQNGPYPKDYENHNVYKYTCNEDGNPR